MKKLLSLVLIAVMLMPAAVLSCDGSGAVLPNVEDETDLCGEAYVAVQASTGCLYGMLSPAEKVSVAQAQSDAGRVRGITAQGVNRARGEMRYMVAGDTVCGMTRVRASVHIKAEYLEIVTGIVKRSLGEDAEVNAANVVACTIVRTAGTVTHRMVGRNVDKMAAGTVLFTGAEMAAVLYITDWDADGELELAFSVNPGPATQRATPAPTSTPKPAKPSKPTATPKPGNDQQCLKIQIQINIDRISIHDINIDSIFKPCGGKKEGC